MWSGPKLAGEDSRLQLILQESSTFYLNGERMGRCLTITFIVSGVLLAGIAFILYEPLPPDVANRWQLQMFYARMKTAFLYGELQYRLGKNDRISAIRSVFTQILRVPLTPEDTAALEVYDTKLNGVPVRIYKPKAAKGPLPGLVFIHGGGWILQRASDYDGECAYLARKSNIVVISVEYRLAPENPFPAAFDDCVRVTQYALKDGGKIGLDSKRIAVGGDSAGGNLAAAVTIKLRDEKIQPPLKAHLFIYGGLQFCDTTLPIWKKREPYYPDGLRMSAFFLGSYVNMTEDQMNIMTSNKYLTPEMQRKCERLVDYKLLPEDLVPEGHVRDDQTASVITEDVKYINSLIDDPRLAPMMAEDLTNLPSTFVLATGWDVLRDEDIIFAKRLQQAGNKVKLLFLPESFHGIFNAFTYGFDAGPKVMTEILDFIDKELK